jgi:carbon starvation protein CstA
MKALVFGILILIVVVFAVLPAGLDWREDVLSFLKGAAPVIALFIGLVSIFIGIADIKDRVEAKKEKAAEEKSVSIS